MKLFLHISVFIFLTLSVSAQDIHFSQAELSPLLLNPAQAGFFDGNMRYAGNHRNQWRSISVPFVTTAVSADFRLMEERLKKGKAAGIGLSLFSDKSGIGGLRTLQIQPSFSYLHALDDDKNTVAGVGVQTGIFHKSMDLSGLSFGSQFSDGFFNTLLPSGEDESNLSRTSMDINSGVFYSRKKPEKSQFSCGVSMFHINRPNQSLLNEMHRISRRTVFHTDLKYIINSKNMLHPMLYYQTQAKAKELVAGMNIHRLIETESGDVYDFFIGAKYRLNDAVVPNAGVQYEKWKVGISYDINVSTLRAASNMKGGFEIGVIYTDRLVIGKNKIPKSIPCYRL